MRYFYLIKEGLPYCGCGDNIEDGYTEYDPSNPPLELQYAFAKQKAHDESVFILAEIAHLESQQARPIRDIQIAQLMGIEPSMDDIVILADIVAEIEDLREKLRELGDVK